jgi:hypothetical protein
MTRSRDNKVHQLHPALLDQLRLMPRVHSPRMQASLSGLLSSELKRTSVIACGILPNY